MLGIEQSEQEKRLVDRMLFFSDAVFAIVLTLMVLELRAPSADVIQGRSGDQAFWLAFTEMWEDILVYIFSFGVVGTWWWLHMGVTRRLRTSDLPTAILNLLFLLSITLVPITQATLEKNLPVQAAWGLYFCLMFISSVLLTLLSLVSSRDNGRLLSGAADGDRLGAASRPLLPGLVFACAFILILTHQFNIPKWAFLAVPILAISVALLRPGDHKRTTRRQVGRAQD